VNAFGFGGINAHVILEQPPRRPRRRVGVRPPAPAEVTEPERILLLSADSPRELARLLEADDRIVLALGGTATDGACRLGIVDPVAAKLAAARKIVATGKPWRGGRDIWFTPRPLLAGGRGKVAFVFPGLEAEFAPRVADVIDHFGLRRRTFDDTEYSAHLASVVYAGVALSEALERIGVHPDGMAGHSLGEWTTAVASGMLDEATFDDMSVTIMDPVALREDLMHAVISEGAAAVALRLGEYPQVYVSHDNAPAQCVVCGPVPQVTRLLADCAARNVLTRTLPYATGVHTPHLQAMVDELRALPGQKSSKSPRVPVWTGVLTAPLPDDADERRELFFRQLVEPVRFRPLTLAMHEAGFRVFLQVGPGALSSLIHDTLGGLDHLTMPVNVASRTGLAQLDRVATALWVEGGRVDLNALVMAGSGETAARRPPSLRMRLDLGSEVIRLGEGAAGLLGTAGAGDDDGALAALRAFAPRSAAAGELAALLEETASSAVAVLTAAGAHTTRNQEDHAS
jgi:acyl transferase domain-containing protein